MPVTPTDDETATLVMARKLLTPEQLAAFRAATSSVSSVPLV
ncbi:MAG: hypothetical protein NTW87_07545 [Planctomycetota bacterium]|nr:hypothetical protein [Planctomycetota bacterium]